MEILTFSGLFVGGSLLGPVLAQVLSLAEDGVSRFFRFLLSLVLIRVHFPVDSIGYVLEALAAKGSTHNTGQEEYVTAWRFIRPLQEHRHVVVRWRAKSWRLWRYRGSWILVWPDADGNETTLYWLRGAVDRNQLFRDIEQYSADKVKSEKSQNFYIQRHYGSLHQVTQLPVPEGCTPKKNNANTPGRVDVWQPVLWSSEEVGQDVQGVELEDLSITPEVQEFLDRVKFWHQDRGWYRDRGITHQLGALFHGKPGTGKTATARATAQMLDIPVHIMDLASMSNEDLYAAWAETRQEAMRMVLIEDFGNVFKGRKNVVDSSGVTFDALLEVIAGIEREDGLILIVTTNHLEEVDEALGVPDATGMSSRPGRLDLMLEFSGLDRPGRVKLANKILRDQAEAEVMADLHADRTPAQLQEFCIRRAKDKKRGLAA